MKRIAAFLLICSMITAAMLGTYAKAEENGEGSGKKSTEASVSVTAKSAVLIEGSTGKVIYERNKDEQLMPASITKIMTLLLIFEALEAGKIKLDDMVSVSEYASSMGGSQVYLEPGETQTVNDMIKCISIASANDASVAMAEFVAGSEEEFVNKMNEKAKTLGMENTHFLNCCGLDDDITEGHYSSAYDISLMSRELITRFPQISDYSTVWMDTIIHKTKKGESEFGLTNTNKLIRSYKGITGLKTGSTSKAKYCLSATATRDGLDMIAVVMASESPKDRFSDAARLLDYGFANCHMYVDEKKNIKVPGIPVKGGKSDEVSAAAEEDFRYVCVNSENPEEITKKMTIAENAPAPVKKGDKLGEIKYYLSGEEIGASPILANEDIEKANYMDYLNKLLEKVFLYEQKTDKKGAA